MSAAPPAVARLAWDSEYFGFEVGRLENATSTERTADALAAGDASGIECTYLQVPGGDFELLAAAQDLGFRVVDVRTELARPLGEADARAGVALREADADDAAWLEDLAARRFAHSRFAADQRFPREAVGGLFRRWVRRGFADPDAEILALPERGGFVIVGRDGRRGSIDLITTDEAAPRGAGGDLLAAAHSTLVGAGCDVVDVVTQATNVPALRLYERLGYRFTASSYWLHRWRSARSARPPRDR